MWPFDKKDDPIDQLTKDLNDMLNQNQPIPGGNNNIGSLGMPQLTTGTGTITVSQITTLLGQFMQPLTQAEQAELTQLTADFEIAKKTAKLDEFKKLPTELRQYVINSTLWAEAVQNIDTTNPEESERLKELKIKQTNGGLLTAGAWGGAGGSSGGFRISTAAHRTRLKKSTVLPEGLSAEDLKAAHSEQCLEEEMLNAT